MEDAIVLNGDVVEVGSADGMEDIVLDSFAENDVGVLGAVFEGGDDGGRIICFATGGLVLGRHYACLGSLCGSWL